MNQIILPFRWVFAKRSRLILVTLVLFAIGFFAWTRRNKTEKTQIQVATVEKGTIISSVSASGTILTANTLSITTNATGVVKKVYVKDGDTVAKGQKLAEIELDFTGMQKNTSAYASYQTAVNSLSTAKNSLRSSESSLAKTYDEIKGHDTDESLTMKETRTKAEVAKDNSYLGVINAQNNLTSSLLSYQASSPVIYAPNSGKVENITIVEGMALSSSNTTSDSSNGSSGQRIAVIKTKGMPLATFNISEVDVSRVTQRQKATITLDSISNKTFTGKVVSVDKIGTTSNGVTNYPVVIQLDTEASDILPNMAATANIILQSKDNVLLVPSSAITTSNGQSAVGVIKGGQEQIVNVEIGISSDSQVEITSGLTEGDMVITGTTVTGATQSGGQSPFGGFGGAGFRIR